MNRKTNATIETTKIVIARIRSRDRFTLVDSSVKTVLLMFSNALKDMIETTNKARVTRIRTLKGLDSLFQPVAIKTTSKIPVIRLMR